MSNDRDPDLERAIDDLEDAGEEWSYADVWRAFITGNHPADPGEPLPEELQAKRHQWAEFARSDVRRRTSGGRRRMTSQFDFEKMHLYELPIGCAGVSP